MSLISLIYKWLLAIKLLILGIKGSPRTQSPFFFFFFCEFAEGVGLNINELGKERWGEQKLEVWNFTEKKNKNRERRFPPMQDLRKYGLCG